MYSNQYEANFGILEKRQTRRQRLFLLIIVLILSSVFGYFYFANRLQVIPEKLQMRKLNEKFPSDWSCKHTLQGHIYVTDDRGYTCSRYYLDPDEKGCCMLNATEIPVQYNCDGCGRFANNLCCTNYVTCVSCCLNPSQKELTQMLVSQFLQQPNAQSKSERGKKLDISLIEDPFDLCTYVCRTSSSSIFNQNSYKNDSLKYCYGMYNKQ